MAAAKVLVAGIVTYTVDVEVAVITTPTIGVGKVLVDAVTPRHEHALEYRTVPEQGVAYIGTLLGIAVI